MSPFTAGLVAIVVVVVGSYLGFTKKIPFRSHFEVKAAFESSNNLKPNSPVRIAGVEVGKVAKVEPTGPGESSADRDHAHQRQRPADPRRRHRQDPPAHLPGGQLLRRPQGGLARARPSSATATSSPPPRPPPRSSSTRCSRPSRPRPARTCRTRVGELGERLRQGPGARVQQVAARPGAGLQVHGHRHRGAAGPRAARPVRRRARLRDHRRRAGPLARPPEVPAAELQHLRPLASPSRTTTSPPPSASCRAPSPRPARRSTASTPPSRATRRLAVGALPGVRSSRPAVAALRPLVAQLDGLVGEDELRGLSAATCAAPRRASCG